MPAFPEHDNVKKDGSQRAFAYVVESSQQPCEFGRIGSLPPFEDDK